mgnify:CR=1 FL=1
MLPLDAAGLARYVEETGAASDSLPEQLASWARERQEAGAGVWAAVAPNRVLGNATMVNIIRQRANAGTTVEAFARANMASPDTLEQVPHLVSKRLELAAGTPRWPRPA